MPEPAQEPAPRRPRRRINPDKAPLDQLPLIKADSPTGPIRVIRGDFDVEELTDAQRRDVCLMHRDEFVVFTNSLGQHTLAWRNQLLDRDIDLTKMGTLPLPNDPGDWVNQTAPHTLVSGIWWLQGRAERLLELAATWEALAADGWEVHNDPRLTPYGDIVQRDPQPDADEADETDPR
jgi:hypothetical protein